MSAQRATSWPPIGGDFVLGNAASPVAVCTLASRSLLPSLAGRPEIAIAGRVFTENVGVERMVQNLVANPRLRVLILCGRESLHQTGQTILSLHRNGLSRDGRVVGAGGPEPFLTNLSPDELRRFQESVEVVDLIGEMNVDVVLDQARRSAVPDSTTVFTAADAPSEKRTSDPRAEVERIQATPDDRAAWRYDPSGFFLIFVDREAGGLQVEHYSQRRELLRIVAGRDAQAICHTLMRLGLIGELQHAAYLGRELAKAETALRLGLRYEQDAPLKSDGQ